MGRIKRALIPGSFDPITLGHYDMAKRASLLFDEVLVVIFDNGEKNTLFTAKERFEFAKAALADLPNVKVDLSHGLLAGYYLEHECSALLKGVRSTSDHDYEFWLSLINRSIDDSIETVFVPARAELQHISSTVAREMLKYGCKLENYIPACIVDAVRSAYDAKK